MAEYDAKSRPANREYRDNYDAIFRKAKADRKERAEKRQQPEKPRLKPSER